MHLLVTLLHLGHDHDASSLYFARCIPHIGKTGEANRIFRRRSIDDSRFAPSNFLLIDPKFGWSDAQVATDSGAPRMDTGRRFGLTIFNAGRLRLAAKYGS